jgi:hypothetical protein
MPGGHQPAPIVGTVFSTQSTIESDGIEHRELRLRLRAAALGRDDHLDRVAGHDLDVHHAGRVVLRVGALARRIGEHAGAQLVVGMVVGAAHAFVDHVLHAHGGVVPAHVHADGEEHRDDAGVLADRAVPSAHMRELIRICAMASFAARDCFAS